MKYKNKKLQLKQVDEQLLKLENSGLEVPHTGWIYTIRQALSMSEAQLGEKMGISQQAVSTLTKREVLGTITTQKLREFGQQFDLQLVYGFIPHGKTLEELVAEKAIKLAEEIVMNTSQHMSLEDQKIADEKLKESVKERTEEIIRTMPRYLWD